MTLEKIALWGSILTTVGGGVVWMLNHLDKRRAKKEAEKKRAQEIEQKMKDMEKQLISMSAHYGKAIEDLSKDLEEVRKDFAQFVQQLLFKSK
jgi:septation ring formation regulator EzrA